MSSLLINHEMPLELSKKENANLERNGLGPQGVQHEAVGRRTSASTKVHAPEGHYDLEGVLRLPITPPQQTGIRTRAQAKTALSNDGDSDLSCARSSFFLSPVFKNSPISLISPPDDLNSAAELSQVCCPITCIFTSNQVIDQTRLSRQRAGLYTSGHDHRHSDLTEHRYTQLQISFIPF